MSSDASPASSSHTTALPPGYVLEGWRIERMLGEGGFGITYLGVDTEIGKRVAIKELLPKEFATRTHGSQVVPHGAHTVEAFGWALDSFINEAKTLVALTHPNIVQIHRLFRANGTAYMVMDYVDGQSMKAWLKELQRPPTEAELKSILMPLLDGLEHVHESGLLHRDIKPDNIFITTTGRPVLLDFGSARVDIGRTQTMTSLVSAGYSPMEQYQQKARQTPATDLYALAASMVRAITGVPPVTAIDRSVDASLQPPVTVSHAGKYSPVFLKAVDAAFAVPAFERPPSVAAWREMLEGGGRTRTEARTGPATRSGEASPVSEPSSGGGAGGRSSRLGFSGKPSRSWLPAAVAVLLSVAAGVVAYLMLNHDGEKEQRSEAEAAPAVVSAPAAKPLQAPLPPVEKEPPALVSGPSPVPPAAPGTPLPVQPQPMDGPDPKQPMDGPNSPNARPTTPAPAVPAVVERKAGDTMEVALPGGEKMVFCWCPPGDFLMGSPASEEGRSSDEDQVRVTISRGYWMARTEVTQGQWEAVMGTSLEQQKAKGNSYGEVTGKGAEHPMYFVSWEDAQAFMEKLNIGRGGMPAGWKWALPSEAQWEYACRAGTRTAYSFGNELNGREANCNGGYPYGTSVKGPYLETTTPVGSYGANAWGLHDMHGNVHEWCADWYGEKLVGGTDPAGPSTGVRRVVRGSSWGYIAASCRAAFRDRYVPGFRDYFVGFRLALVPSKQ